MDMKSLMAMLQQMTGGDPSKLASMLSGLGGPGAMPGMPAGGPPGAPPPPGGAPPPPGGPGGAPPPPAPGMPGGNTVPGLSMPPPAPGGGMPPPGGMADNFGPDPGGPSMGGMPPPPQAPLAGARDPQMGAVKMALGQAAFGGQERDLDRQQKLADELRSEAAPTMRGNSRVMTAANPMEMLATGINRVGGQLKSNALGGERKKMFDDRMERLRNDMSGYGPE